MTQVEQCPIDHTPTKVVDGIEVCERGHKWAPSEGVFKLIAPRARFIAIRRTVLVGKKEVCRASSLEWAKRICRALNHEQEKTV